MLRVQTGEIGPIYQCIAGLDIAFNDLIAKKEIQNYASGINPNNPEKTIEKCLSKGILAFKLKIGF